MESTIHAQGGAVVSVPAAPAVPAAGVAASHLAGAVRLNGVGLNGVGRGVWRGQPSLGTPMAIAAVMAAPAGKVRTSTVTKQFRTTVYEGPWPWKVPV